MKLFDFRDTLEVYYIVTFYNINVGLRVQTTSSYNLSFRRNEASRRKSQVFVHTDQKFPIILCISHILRVLQRFFFVEG